MHEDKKRIYGTDEALILIVLLSLMNIILYGNMVVQYASIIGTFGLLLYIAIKNRILNNKLFFLTVGLNLVSLLFTMFLYHGEGAALTFINVLLTLQVFNNITVDIRVQRKIHLVFSVILTLFLCTVDLTYAYAGFCYSALGMRININSFGILSLGGFYQWMCFLSKTRLKKQWVFVLYTVVIVVFSLWLWTSSSRASLGAMVLFFLLCMFKRRPFSYRTMRWLVGVGLCVSLAIVPIYIELASNGNFALKILGKSIFSGRQIVWQSAWDTYLKSPLIGTGTTYVLQGVGKSVTVSAHNTLLSILYVLGIIPTISFMLMITRRLPACQGNAYHRVSQFAFLSSLVLTFFESFYTDAYFYILFLILLLPLEQGEAQKFAVKKRRQR